MSSERQYSEEELVRLIQQKDKPAFNHLYDVYSAALNGIIIRILRDEESAQAILQEVFIKIWLNIKAYERSKSTLFTWMLNIARDLSFEKLRMIESHSIQSASAIVHDGESRQHDNMVLDKVEAGTSVNKLKREYKTVFDMAFLGGYNQKEISEIMNIPIGKVKAETHKSFIELRSKFS